MKLNLEEAAHKINMGKVSKVTYEFKVGDLIFAKIKGSPYWPARVRLITTNESKETIKPLSYLFILRSKQLQKSFWLRINLT